MNPRHYACAPSSRNKCKDIKQIMNGKKALWNSARKKSSFIYDMSIEEIEKEYEKIKNKESELSSSERREIVKFVGKQ